MPSAKSFEVFEIINGSRLSELEFTKKIKDSVSKIQKDEANENIKEDNSKIHDDEKDHYHEEEREETETQVNQMIQFVEKEMTQESKSPYEEILSKCKDTWYFKPLRNWERRMGFVTPLLWREILLITTFHIITIAYVVSMFFTGTPKWQTLLFAYAVTFVAGFGVTGGAHRLWCHKSYKAKWPLKIILLFCYSVAGQYNIYQWVRDHRVHHKFSETSSDPHNAKRGFFFSHVGWLMMKKHPDVIREGKKIDMSDILSDPFVEFHTRYFTWFKLLFCFVLPSLVPWLCWNETYINSVLSQSFLRYVYTLNGTWSVNSIAHLWGYKPYDWKIMPAENRGVSIVALGEGWHNYHHTFPWDYKAAELGRSDNFTTAVLDLFAKIGWAYDLREASPELVRNVINSNRDKMYAKH